MTLVDGKLITGTVLCAGARRIIVLVDAREVELDPAAVQSIKRAAPVVSAVSYVTAPVENGTVQIVRRGTAEAEPAVVRAPAKPSAAPAGPARPGARNDKPAPTARQNLEKALKDPAVRAKLKEMNRTGELKKLVESYNLKWSADIQKMADEIGQ